MFSNPDCVAIKGVKGHICPWHSRPSSAGAPAVPRANEPCGVGGKACRSARLWAGSSHGRLPWPSEAPPEEKMREWPPASGFPHPWAPPSAIQCVAGGADAEADERGVGVAEALWLSPRQLASHASGRGRRAESCAGTRGKTPELDETWAGGCGAENTVCNASWILLTSRFLDNLKRIKGVWVGFSIIFT